MARMLPRSIEGQDGFRKLQGRTPSVGEDPRMKPPSRTRGTLRSPRGPVRVRRLRVYSVGLGGMLRQVQGPLLPHEPLQELLNHGLDLFSHFP